MDKNINLLKKICEYDIKYGNEVRGLQSVNSKLYDKASLYTRSDIYNLNLGNIDIDKKIRSDLKISNEEKYILGSERYVSNFTENYIKVCEGLYAFQMKSVDNIVISTYSRQYIYYLLEKSGHFSMLNQINVLSKSLDTNFKDSLGFYSQRVTEPYIETINRHNEYKNILKIWFGNEAYSINITNSGTSANWVCYEMFADQDLRIYLDEAFYYENINYLKSRNINITSKINLADIIFLSISNTNYFKLHSKYRVKVKKIFDQLENLNTKVRVVIDITADPSFRASTSNELVEIIYTMSLTKLCGDICLYFAGAIICPSRYHLKFEEVINKLGVEMDPVAKRFFLYPNPEIALNRIQSIKSNIRQYKRVRSKKEFWWIEKLIQNIVIHPPLQFFVKLKNLMEGKGNDTNHYLRLFYHNIQKGLNVEIIKKHKDKIVLGDSFGMSYMRMNVQGRNVKINNNQINIRFPRISFGYGIPQNLQHSLTDEIVTWLDNNWEKYLEDAFCKDLHAAISSELN